jgi:hypothetical protein
MPGLYGALDPLLCNLCGDPKTIPTPAGYMPLCNHCDRVCTTPGCYKGHCAYKGMTPEQIIEEDDNDND